MVRVRVAWELLPVDLGLALKGTQLGLQTKPSLESPARHRQQHEY